MYTGFPKMAKVTRRLRKRNKTRGGRRVHIAAAYNFGPGNVHYFHKGNMDALDRFMQKRTHPVIIRHHSDDCIHCKRFKAPWRAIEASVNPRTPYSVASLDPEATSHITRKYPKYPHVNGFPAVVLVDKAGVPIEHTGPNTLKDVQNFLRENGLELRIVPIGSDSSESASPPPSSFDDYSDTKNMNDDANLGAGLGAAGLGAAGLGAAAANSTDSAVSAATGTDSADSAATGADSAATGTDSAATGADSAATGADSAATGADSVANDPLASFKETVSKVDNSINQKFNELTANLFGTNPTEVNAAGANAGEAAGANATGANAGEATGANAGEAAGANATGANATGANAATGAKAPSSGGRRGKGKRSRRKNKRASTRRKHRK